MTSSKADAKQDKLRRENLMPKRTPGGSRKNAVRMGYDKE
jgi:hypothetical protein